LDLPADFAPPDTSDWFVPATEITHTIDVSGFITQKRASMEAHASQATSASSNVRSLEMFLALPEEWFTIAFGTEWFVDRSLAPGTAADDIFATLHRTPTNG
jgi:LmbE family N-acetylglucosaminyl deacetylase